MKMCEMLTMNDGCLSLPQMLQKCTNGSFLVVVVAAKKAKSTPLKVEEKQTPSSLPT